MTDCYNEFRGEGNPQNLCLCKNHFSKVFRARAAAKFSRAFNHALAIKESGLNNEDVKKAHSIYECDEGTCFTLMED